MGAPIRMVVRLDVLVIIGVNTNIPSSCDTISTPMSMIRYPLP